ncbi:lipopolysaccharide assembly protein LapB [uncultured Methanobrevibacter sp.]|uniref:tetratricopeptide repeat protein n=1 Tax=uncultured Methanobrevibacter sp. TaxID=253161 RepID=UPI0025F77091|nr:hypothetical protein [uncultured Methanobrevibacter sp.]
MSSWKIPVPNDGKHFENLCCELWKRIWKTDNVKPYLRQGYSQNGVDLYYQSDEGIHAIQCKCVKKLTVKQISKEINLAKSFKPKLKSYTIATTVESNDKLTNHVLIESEKSDFQINIVFWQEILSELKKSSNSDILKDYYPEIYRDEVHILNIINDANSHFQNEDFTELEIILNTLREFCFDFNKDARYDFHILDGKFNLLCGKHKEAGSCFLEAYEFSEENMDSKYFKALGLFYTGHRDDARNLCNEILESDNLNENAYSLLILIDKDIVIPDDLKNSSRILYNKALVKYRENDYGEAYNLLKSCDLENKCFKLITCATTRFILLQKDENYPLNIHMEDKIKLKKIECIFQRAIDKLSDTILKYHKDSFYNLLSLNSLTNNWDLLDKNIQRGLKLGFDDDDFIYHRANFLSVNEEYDDAIDLIRENVKEDIRFSRLYAKILYDKKDTESLIEFLENLVHSLDKNSTDFIFCVDMLLESYLKQDSSDKAIGLAKTIKNDFYQYFFKANVCNSHSEKIKLLNECLNDIGYAPLIFKLNLAKLFTGENEFKTAILIYEDYLNISEYSPFLEDLIYCYYNEMEYKKVILICESFIEKGEFFRFLFEFEIKCYTKINDFDKVLELINLYCTKHEKTYFMEFLEARINLIQENYEDLDSFLNKSVDFRKLGWSLSKEFYNLFYLRCTASPKLLEFLFEIREIYKNHVYAHEWFLIEMLRLNLDFIKPLKVDYDMGVLIDIDGNEKWIYVTDNLEYNLNINQFNYIDYLIDFKIGDEIKLKNGFNIIILDILNKYHYAFQRSHSLLTVSETANVHSFKSNDIEELIKTISKYASNRSKLFENLKETYNKKQIPFAFFSKFSGLDIIDIYFYLKTLGLKSFAYNENLNSNKKLVFDISSFITAYLLDILDLIKDNYNIATSYSVLLILKEIMTGLESNVGRESFSMVEDNGENFIVDNNYEYKYNLVKTLVDFIEVHCDLIPSYNLFEINDKQKVIIKTLDESYVNDVVLIAMDGNTLISDDLSLKLFVSEPFDIESCGSLTLIQDMLSKTIISLDMYNKLISQLFLLNFNNVPLTSEIIYESIKNEEYDVIFKFLINYYKYPKKNFELISNELIRKLDRSNVIENIFIKLISNTLRI